MPEPSFDQLERVRLAALRLLEARARSRAELTERLLARKLPRAAVHAVVDRLVELKLVNDELLAGDVISGATRDLPAGEALLRAKLEQRGLDEQVAGPAVDAHERRRSAHDRAVEAATLAAARLPPKLDDVARWRRVMALLARRGFDEDTAAAAAEAALGPPPDHPHAP